MAPGNDETAVLTLADIERIKHGDMRPMGDPIYFVLPPCCRGQSFVAALVSAGAVVLFNEQLPPTERPRPMSDRHRLHAWLDESHRLVSPPAVPAKKVDPRPWVKSRAEQWRNNRRRT